MSQKTSGIVKGAINLFTGLINNFKTLGGTIMNIGAVALPFILKGIRSFQKTFSIVTKKIAADALTVKAAIGGWVDILITAVA